MTYGRALPALLLSLAAACGDDSAATGGGGADSGTGGGATGSGGAQTTSSALSSSVTSTSTGESCADFADEPTAAVVVELVNDTGAVLYLGDPDPSCGAFEPFDAYEPGGDPPATLDAFRGACDFSCEQLQTAGCQCTGDCAPPFFGKLDPGGKFVTEWPGAVYEALQMPEACFSPGCSGLCSRAVLRSDIRASAYAYPSLACTDDGTCDCETSAEGFCELGFDSGAQGVSGTPAYAETHWTAGEPVLTLVFGTGAR